MKTYVKTYLNYFGYSGQEFIPCEVCNAKAIDIHHIKSRGMGGTKKKWINEIENLMALCRSCHEQYGDKVQYVDFLKDIHRRILLKSNHDNEKIIYDNRATIQRSEG